MRLAIMAIRLAALLQLTGCDYNVLLVRLHDNVNGAVEPLPRLPDYVVEACDFWGIACHAHTESSYGVWTLDIVVDAGPHIDGRSSVDQTELCIASGIAEPKWNTVAHEIGHTFGLGPEHVDDEENVMYSNSPKFPEATEDQEIDVQRAVRQFSLCYNQ